MSHRGDVLLSTDRCLFYGEMSDCPFGGGCHCPLVEMSASAQESACMRTPWRLQPTLSLKCLQVHWADVGEGSISVQSVFGRLGHGDLSDTLVSYEIYIL